ncbi:MAG: protein translocase subunit SecD, partial [Pseudomonadota bacterium]|nr:protein translocase subunit SecD [Pseudomonadota bacterium]
MLYFSRWKIVSILVAIFLGLAYASPNLMSPEMRESIAPEGTTSWLPNRAMTLGLDLQGGSHILLQVDRAALQAEKIDTLEDDIRRILREARIGYRFSRSGDDAINVSIRETGDVESAKDKLEELTLPVTGGVLGQRSITEIAMSEPSTGVIRMSLTTEGIRNAMSHAVTQSLEVIRIRIDELGTTEPLVPRPGDDRVLVQVPGLDDPTRLKALIGQTAKMTFHLVSTEMSAQDALNSRPPAGTRILYEDEDPPIPYVVESRAMVDGENLTDAQPGFDQRTNEPIVTFRFDTKGSTRFCQVTSANVGRPFAIVLDDQIISAPVIRDRICGGSGQISGNFTVQSANDLAVLLRAGALPAKLDVIEERTVGPGLGADSIEAGQTASIVGAIAVMIFMIVTYGFLGIVANLALIANISMIIAILSVLGATLTLPGIAGIVLTMGMAVDSNVLIYERIREERRLGRSLIQSFDAGFRHALATILDANITTLIAAVILFYLGSGPIRGFAITLAIGVITTVFTAYTFTRLMVALWVRFRRPREVPARLFGIIPEDTKLRFMIYRRIAFPFSSVLAIASIVLFFVVSLNFGIDFRGGTLIEVQSKAATADVGDIRGRLGELNIGEVQVQEFGSPADVLIRVESQGEGDLAEQSVEAKVRASLEQDYDLRRVEVVGPTISGELARAGTIAVIASLLAIMFYIWLRFEWQFSLGAVIATLHDVILTIGMFAVLQLEFSLSSIAAILTIVGYSLNDTVVV